MPPVLTIDAALAQAPSDIALVTYGNPPPATQSLSAQFDLWTNGMFGNAGAFPPSQNDVRDPGQRVVTDWYAQHVIAKSEIEGPAVGAAGVIGTSAVINAVVRVLWAVKYGLVNNQITAAQEAAVIALYNLVWT